MLTEQLFIHPQKVEHHNELSEPLQNPLCVFQPCLGVLQALLEVELDKTGVKMNEFLPLVLYQTSSEMV